MTPPAVAVVGTGSIGTRHLSCLASLGVDDLTACSEHRRRSSVQVGERVVPCVTTYDAVLSGSAAVVIVANPSSLHAEYARRAIEAGKHVLVEKPAAMSNEELNELIVVARRYPAQVVGVVQQFRFHPLLKSFRDAALGGMIGGISAVEARQGEHIADYHPGEDFRASYSTRPELGGGVLLTQIHLLDLCCHLFGQPEQVRSLLDRPGRLGLDVEEGASFLGRLPDGASIYGRVDFLARPPRFLIEAVGDEGRARWDYYESAWEVVDRRGAVVKREEIPFDRDHLFRGVHTDFLDAVAAGSRPRCTLEDASGPLALVEAIRRSANEAPVTGVGASVN